MRKKPSDSNTSIGSNGRRHSSAEDHVDFITRRECEKSLGDLGVHLHRADIAASVNRETSHLLPAEPTEGNPCERDFAPNARAELSNHDTSDITREQRGRE